jgi:hypothetical protein
MLVVATGPPADEWPMVGKLQPTQLKPLDAEQIRAVTEAVLGDVDDRLLSLLNERSAGNCYWLQALLEHQDAVCSPIRLLRPSWVHAGPERSTSHRTCCAGGWPPTCSSTATAP